VRERPHQQHAQFDDPKEDGADDELFTDEERIHQCTSRRIAGKDRTPEGIGAMSVMRRELQPCSDERTARASDETVTVHT